ncbi:MAG TPA: ECF-type sigma factor [Urbifossiella sp.]|jgi:RNA polymerase sigma factor (TIGR02999 family)|nr:ECF-type sigma factor [Urbifossiella sp.]
MTDVTRLLDAASAGDRQATADLFAAVYDELRGLAAARMAAEASGHTLQPTALVNEAFVRLVGPADPPRWENRAHFFGAAAEAMRRILIDAARRKKRTRHGGGRARVPLPLEIPADPDPAAAADLLAVDEVVDQLAAHDPQAAELVKLHVFAGLTVERAGEVLGVSARTAYRVWTFARAWMFRRLDGPPAS